jgi:hypothetical protein
MSRAAASTASPTSLCICFFIIIRAISVAVIKCS